MRILSRYVTLEFLAVFLITLAGMTGFMLLIGVGREAVREGLSLGPLLRILPYIIPVSMRFSIPAAALLAACSVYGRMSGENEVVAVKSMGISPQAVVSPVLILAFLISIFAVWINDVAVSWGRPGISRVITESIEQIAYGMLRAQRSYTHDNFSITVKGVEEDRLLLPTLTFFGKGEDAGLMIAAEEAVLRRDPESNRLMIALKDASVENPDYEGALPGQNELTIDLQQQMEEGELLSPSDCALYQLPLERQYARHRIQLLEKSLAVNVAHGLLTGDIYRLQDDSWGVAESELNQLKYRQNRLRTEPWRRWANGFSCFFFVYVGVPLAIRRKHSDFVTSFFLTFMPILLLYYPLMAYGVDRAKAGALPQYAVWLGNAACGLWGLWLMRRVMRY